MSALTGPTLFFLYKHQVFFLRLNIFYCLYFQLYCSTMNPDSQYAYRRYAYNKKSVAYFIFRPGTTWSEKISLDKSDEILSWCRNFRPTKFFVRRNFCPANIFKTLRYSTFRRTKVTTFRPGGEIFFRRNFCPAKYCSIMYPWGYVIRCLQSRLTRDTPICVQAGFLFTRKSSQQRNV